MTLTISDLALAESMTDLKVDESAQVSGGIFGGRTTKINITNYTQDVTATDGATAFVSMQDINIYETPYPTPTL